MVANPDVTRSVIVEPTKLSRPRDRRKSSEGPRNITLTAHDLWAHPAAEIARLLKGA